MAAEWVQKHRASEAATWPGARSHEPALLYEVWTGRFGSRADALSPLFGHLGRHAVATLAAEKDCPLLAAFAARLPVVEAAAEPHASQASQAKPTLQRLRVVLLRRAGPHETKPPCGL